MYRFITAFVFLLLAGCAGTSIPTQNISQPSKPTIALVLGGGGGKGLAHIGVIDALHQNNIYPDIIIGSSAGAMVGAIYADGKTPDELYALAMDLRLADLMEITPSHQGLLDGNKLRRYINTHAHADMTKLPKKFAAVATDSNGQAVLFTTGETGLVVQASASVPRLFIAPRIPERYGQKYHDGGSSALVPARFAASLGADVVIAVDVLSQTQPLAATQIPNAQTPSMQSLTISTDSTGIEVHLGDRRLRVPVDFAKLPVDISPILPPAYRMDVPDELWQLGQDPKQLGQKLDAHYPAMAQIDIAASDVLIRPDLARFSTLDISNPDAIIAIGKQATLSLVPEIKTAIAKHCTKQLACSMPPNNTLSNYPLR